MAHAARAFSANESENAKSERNEKPVQMQMRLGEKPEERESERMKDVQPFSAH